MRYRRTVQGSLAAIAVGAVLTACVSPAATPRNTASPTQHRLAEKAVANLQNEIGRLARDAAALSVDATSLQTNLDTEMADVAMAKSDSHKSQVLLAASPSTTHRALCRSVNVVRIDAENVANDGQFVVGFISGLHATERNVVTETSSVRSESIGVHRLTSSSSGLTAAAVPPASEITSALNEAAHSESVARAAIGNVAGLVDTSQTMVFAELNVLVSTTGCGARVVAPHPLVTPTG